jgi:hypothetical protein
MIRKELIPFVRNGPMSATVLHIHVVDSQVIHGLIQIPGLFNRYVSVRSAVDELYGIQTNRLFEVLF